MSYSDELLARIHQASGELKLDRLDAVPDVLERLFDSECAYRTSWHQQWLQRLTTFLARHPRYQGSAVQKRLDERRETFDGEIERWTAQLQPGSGIL